MSDAPSPSGDGHAPDDAASGAATHEARAEAIFEATIRHDLPPDVALQDFVVIDPVTGDYEVDADPLVADERLFARHPEARGRAWTRRVGSPVTYGLGARVRYADPRPASAADPSADAPDARPDASA
jgi:hypothetical protein